MSEIKLEKCEKTQKETIEELVRKYPQQFYIAGDKLEVTEIIQHEIMLKPVRVNLLLKTATFK